MTPWRTSIDFSIDDRNKIKDTIRRINRLESERYSLWRKSQSIVSMERQEDIESFMPKVILTIRDVGHDDIKIHIDARDLEHIFAPIFSFINEEIALELENKLNDIKTTESALKRRLKKYKPDESESKKPKRKFLFW
jgi:hypothetical protein